MFVNKNKMLSLNIILPNREQIELDLSSYKIKHKNVFFDNMSIIFNGFRSKDVYVNIENLISHKDMLKNVLDKKELFSATNDNFDIEHIKAIWKIGKIRTIIEITRSDYENNSAIIEITLPTRNDIVQDFLFRHKKMVSFLTMDFMLVINS